MQTLSKGYKRPDNLDRGSVFFDALRDNITQINGHTHNGVNSEAIPVDSFAKLVVMVSAAGWTTVGDGTFKKTVTMPGSFVWGGCSVLTFGDGGLLADKVLNPKLLKLTPTTFEIYMLVSDQAVKLVFV